MKKTNAQSTLEYLLREGTMNSADRYYVEKAIKDLDGAVVLTDAQSGFLYGLIESVLAIATLKGMKEHKAMNLAKEILELLK